MAGLTRRQFTASAAGAASLGLTGSLAFLPSAMAADIKEKGFYSYKIGNDLEVISIFDGGFNKPHDPNFIDGVSVEETKKALEAGGLPSDTVPITFAYTIIKSGERTVLIDAGTGGQLAPSAGSGMAAMGRAGIKPEDINLILISHFHPDHIFGLMEKDNNTKVFGETPIMIPEAELAFWNDPITLESVPEGRKGLVRRIQSTLGKWDNVEQFTFGQEIMPGVRAEDATGHTPGHTAFHLSSGDEEMLLVGDIANVPALFLQNPDWQVAFDMDKDKAEATRKQMADRIIADGITVAGYHFGFPNSGKLRKDGEGYAFVPTDVNL